MKLLRPLPYFILFLCICLGELWAYEMAQAALRGFTGLWALLLVFVANFLVGLCISLPALPQALKQQEKLRINKPMLGLLTLLVLYAILSTAIKGSTIKSLASAFGKEWTMLGILLPCCFLTAPAGRAIERPCLITYLKAGVQYILLIGLLALDLFLEQQFRSLGVKHVTPYPFFLYVCLSHIALGSFVFALMKRYSLDISGKAIYCVVALFAVCLAVMLLAGYDYYGLAPFGVGRGWIIVGIAAGSLMDTIARWCKRRVR